MAKMDVNTLMIGRSGTGKSSLLNYLYGKEIEKTGTGKPVTEKGIFEHAIELNNSCVLHIYDTWGLEPNKTEEWQELIHEEIKKHDADDIKDWFHFILYCINAQSARIEDFEEDFIKSLVNTTNHIIIALTHCDNANEKDLNSMTDNLLTMGIKSDDIVHVCSVEQELIGGKRTHNFGREILLERIQNNFWHSICEKVPKIIHNKAVELINQTTEQLKSYVDGSFSFFSIHSNKKFKELNAYCNDKYSQCWYEIKKFSEEKINESVSYYVEICNTFYLYLFQKGCGYKDRVIPKINYSMDFTDKLAENIAFTVLSCIPLVNLLVPKAMKEIKRDEYKEHLDTAHEKSIEQCDKMYEDLSEYLRGLKI